MDGEILLAANKTHDSRQPVGRRKHVVVDRIARSRDVEELFHAVNYTKKPSFVLDSCNHT